MEMGLHVTYCAGWGIGATTNTTSRRGSAGGQVRDHQLALLGRPHHLAHHRGGLAAPPDLEADHGVVAVRVGEGEAFHCPLAGLQGLRGQVRG